MRPLIAAALLLAVVGCSQRTPAPKALTLDEAAARLSQLAGKPIRPFATNDFGREQNPDARSVLVAADNAQSIVEALRPELGPGLLVFVGCENSLADPPAEGSEVVVALGADQFDILRNAKSDGVNHGLETEDLVRKLKTYDEKYGIEIFHAETDVLEFKLKTMPKDMSAFCKDLYEFCPDIVEQGAGTISALEIEILKNRGVYLWWD